MAATVSPLAQAISFSPGSKSALSYLDQLLVNKNVDPRAANAVFSQEGASGAIGDDGHAFGPGQFNDAGGVWTGKYPGLTPEQKNEQAWSQSGLSDLASHVAAVAAGLKGEPAIDNIVTRFERPAQPQHEVQGATAAYGGLPAYTPSPLASVAKPGLKPTASATPAHVGTSPLILAALKLLMS